MAVKVAVWLDAMVPVFAVNVADVAPAATVTDPGTTSSALLEESATAAPPEAAAAPRATVQEPELLEGMLPDAQLSEERVAGAGAAAIEMLNAAVAIFPALSITCDVKFGDDAVVGIPLITPVLESTSPVGSDPETIDQL